MFSFDEFLLYLCLNLLCFFQTHCIHNIFVGNPLPLEKPGWLSSQSATSNSFLANSLCLGLDEDPGIAFIVNGSSKLIVGRVMLYSLFNQPIVVQSLSTCPMRERGKMCLLRDTQQVVVKAVNLFGCGFLLVQ
jgi:hypothetical protein